MAEKKNVELGKRLQAERKKRGWDPVELAHQLRAASAEPHRMTDVSNIVRNIERWEAGQVGKLQERWRLLYSAAFDIPDTILFPTEPPSKTSVIVPDDEEMERRRLLQALAALGVVSSPAIEALRNIQHSVDTTLGGADRLHLEEWEETVAEYGYTYTTRPPQQLLPDLAADLVSVRTIMARGKTDRLFTSWSRVTSGLAVLLAKTLSDLHQPRQARTWWVTAQQAADVSGDTDLRLWVAAERLVYGLYERRPTAILLRKADDIMGNASTTPCRGLAHASTVRAQLLALDGTKTDEARRELTHAAEIFEQLPTDIVNETRSLAGWCEYRLRYTEAWAYAHLGDPDRVDIAVDRALHVRAVAHQRGRSQLGLLQAFGRVRHGDVTEGVRKAQTVYEAHPVDDRTLMVAALADLVLDAVPEPQRSEPVVSSYRELLSDGGLRAIT